MFGFLKRIAGEAPAPKQRDAQAEGRLGAAALLVALARSDDDYAEDEKARIDAALSALFEFNDGEVAALRAEAELAQENAADFHRFALAVKEAYSVEERVVFIEAAWAVVLADGARDPDENALMRRLASMLGLEDRVSAEARRRAEARGG